MNSLTDTQKTFINLCSVDPVATQTLVGPQSDVQADVPATDTAVLASSAVTSALSSIEAPKPQPPVAQSIEDSSIAAQADVAATGKAATNPPDVPDATVQAVPAPIEAPVNPVTSTNAVQELRPVSSSSDGPSDVVMGESSDSSSQHEEHIQDGDQECSSDAYEPSEAVAPPNDARSPSTSPVPAGSTVSLANSDADPQEPSSRASQIPEQISLGVNESTPEQGVEATREVHFVSRHQHSVVSNQYHRPLNQHRALMRCPPKMSSPLTRAHYNTSVLIDTTPTLLRQSLVDFGLSRIATGSIRTNPSAQTNWPAGNAHEVLTAFTSTSRP